MPGATALAPLTSVLTLRRGVSPGAGRAFVGCMQSHLVHELTLDPDTAQRMHARNDEAIAAAKDAHQAKVEL